MDPYGEDMPPILRAAYEGDAHGTLRRAIADCADLNVEDEDGYTALHWLCTNRPHVYDDTVPHGTPDRLACISALLEAGADVNKIGGHIDEDDGEDPCTPLLDALFEFRKDRTDCAAITTMLLRAGADARRGTEDGLSPLHIAAMWGLAFIIPTLIAAGAEVGAIWHEPKIGEWTGSLEGYELQTPLEATINLLDGSGMLEVRGASRTREFAMLLRAGAKIPRGVDLPPYRDADMDLPPYLDAVARAGGYAQYEKAHRTRLAAIFIPKFPRVPAEIIPTIVAFWADCGGH